MPIYRRRVLSSAFMAAVASTIGIAPGHAARGREIAVIGAGIIGASMAYHLAKAGASVTVLDANGPATGATRNSFAWLNAMSKSPQPYYELNLLGILGWHRLQAEMPGRLPVQWGGTVQWASDPGVVDRTVERIMRQQAWGYAVRTIEESELRRLVPGFEPGPVALAYFGEMEGTVNPALVTQILLSQARNLGARVEYPVAVTGFDMEQGAVRRVLTTTGALNVTDVVLAAGLGCSELAAMLGCMVPLESSPGLLAHTETHPVVLERLLLGPGANIKQNIDGSIVTGESFAANPGVDATREYGEALLRNAAEYVPALADARLAEVTLGHRVLPQDSFPIVGSLPTATNAYVAAMHSGMTMAPIIGQLGTTELLTGQRSALLDPFRPERHN